MVKAKGPEVRLVHWKESEVPPRRKRLEDAGYAVESDHPESGPELCHLAGYSGTPLPKKLMIKEGSVVALIGAPDDFEPTLGELPPGVSLRRNRRGKPDTAIWFVRSLAELEREIERMGKLAPRGLWIAWPKKASGVVTDVGEAAVRATGLAAGLVDHKICAIDATWSGLRFVERAT